jgi:eight-cysteine-cluster-containing protein
MYNFLYKIFGKTRGIIILTILFSLLTIFLLKDKDETKPIPIPLPVYPTPRVTRIIKPGFSPAPTRTIRITSIPKPRRECNIGGCSGTICSNLPPGDIISTCEWREDYECYKYAVCEIQDNGKCGWTQTPQSQECFNTRGNPAQ